MKCGRIISVVVALVIAGCGSSAGIFEKMNAPSTFEDGIYGGDGYGTPIRQNFTQNYEFAAYDILWVIDNSGSMLDEINYVRDNIATFAAAMNVRRSIEYRMAVVNTDWRDTVKGHGKFRGPTPIINYNDSSPLTQFQAAVNDINFCSGSGAGCSTSGNEMGLNSARQALQDNGASFLRDNANLFIITVSDENDVSCVPNSGSTACNGGGNGSLASVSTFTSYFSGVKPSGTGEVGYYPIVGISNDAGCAFASLGTRYLQTLAGLTNGASGSICEAAMGNSMISIANTIAENGLCFTLAHAPRFTSLDVYVDNVLMNEGYSFNTTKNAVCFDTNHVPTNGQKIGIEYYRND